MAQRGALVTGVGGRSGIAAAVCRALLRDGWSVVATGRREDAAAQPPAGEDGDGLDGLVDELSATGAFEWHDADLADTAAIPRLLDAAQARLGRVDALVAAHARSLSGGLLDVTAAEFDAHEDAAELVAFLCSDRGGWITGQVLRSDGGFSTLR